MSTFKQIEGTSLFFKGNTTNSDIINYLREQLKKDDDFLDKHFKTDFFTYSHSTTISEEWKNEITLFDKIENQMQSFDIITLTIINI